VCVFVCLFVCLCVCNERGNFLSAADGGKAYSRINSTNCPASGGGCISEPRLMSHVGTVRKFVCS